MAIGEGIALSRRTVFSPYIVKHYPRRGEVIVQGGELSSRAVYQYEDKVGDFRWTLHEDTATIQGYKASKATCDFRGRSYEAWYTPEIPISDGPYVFSGLPGLILKIADTKGHYTFSLTGFHEVKGYEPIYLLNQKIVPMTREGVAKTKRNMAANPALMLKGLTGTAKIDPEVQKRLSKPRPYNPIELE